MSTTLTERLSQTERVEWTLQLSIVERGRDGFWKTVEALARSEEHTSELQSQ